MHVPNVNIQGSFESEIEKIRILPNSLSCFFFIEHGSKEKIGILNGNQLNRNNAPKDKKQFLKRILNIAVPCFGIIFEYMKQN